MVDTETTDRLVGAVDLLKALASAIRLATVVELREGPRCVHELQTSLEASGRQVSQPLLSQHLKVLKDSGLVTDRKEGSRRIYQLDPTGIEQVRSYLDRFWGAALGAFKLAAERPARAVPTESREEAADPQRGERRHR